MRPLSILSYVIIIYIAYGLFLTNFELQIIPKELTAENPDGFHDYKGVTNVHVDFNSSPEEFERVFEAAQAVGLDFISITDLNAFERPNILTGYHNNLLVFVDGEYSYLSSRLLNYNALTNRHLQGVGRSQVIFADLLTQSTREPEIGIFILAHPLKPGFRWVGEYPVGLDGLEIINLKSLWQDAWINSKISFFWSLLIYPFNDRLALIRLFRQPKQELGLWDELSKKRHTIGIAGVDAEARLNIGPPQLPLRFPSYQTLFSFVRNHVLLKSELTGDAASDNEKITAALKQGQFYMSLDTLADPKGFNAKVVDINQKIFPMGSELKFQKDLELVINLPHKPQVPFDIIVFRDGERMLTSNSQITRYMIHTPGVYRVLVRVIPTFPLPDGKKWVPWIFSNPFYVRS